MSGLPKHFEFMNSTAAEGLGLVVADSAQNAASLRQAESESNILVEFPKRPDLTALSETIPLFYIGQNNRGFWVAREADGRCGGVFLLRRSALRFAQQKSAHAGCATMFLDEPRELDVVNEGNRIVEPLTAVIDLVRHRAPTFIASFAMAIAKWRKFATQISRFCAGELKDRAAPELVRCRYTLSSKNDGDTSFPDAP
jgi:hypothetical protein